ncbi:hypothetical protein TIFTF001_014535 [Ficus carica]|uniref:Uncharacterized protein n=1 Tax=Ficus carica TaxID=3494 RepID=A0AA88A3X3_FICCA|nr:hypothetical protein TIFTF001_014535 [Ficus carica]
MGRKREGGGGVPEEGMPGGKGGRWGEVRGEGPGAGVPAGEGWGGGGLPGAGEWGAGGRGWVGGDRGWGRGWVASVGVGSPASVVGDGENFG